MLCYRHHGLIPISDSRFCLSASNPISISRPECIKFSTRNRSGLFKPKVKASMNNGFVALESSRCERSFYELLGVPESGSLVEVKHAYKKLAQKYHPDVSPPGRVEEYTKRFIQLKEAYETLPDPMRRAMYDRDIATGLHFAAFSSRHRHYYDHQWVGDEVLIEMLSTLFKAYLEQTTADFFFLCLAMFGWMKWSG